MYHSRKAQFSILDANGASEVIRQIIYGLEDFLFCKEDSFQCFNVRFLKNSLCFPLYLMYEPLGAIIIK